MPTRRDFLKAGAVATGALATGALATGALATGALPALAHTTGHPPAPLRLLILGGTGFIGPHLVRLAVERGHTVSIFTRGRRDAELPASVERLVGDRAITAEAPEGDLRALAGRRWDAVIDDSATDPRWVRASSSLLRDSGWYLFVSSTHVYNPYTSPNTAETVPVETGPADTTDYGLRKAQSEAVTMAQFGERGCVVRPGYIVGPGDTTDRFPYWPQRFAAGGEILVPGRRDDPSQLIDVRDLVAFMLQLAEQRASGRYNCTGPAQFLPWSEFVAQATAAVAPAARLTWVDDHAFLRAHEITYAVPWMIPDGDNAYHLRIDNRKAVAAGLTFRPIGETVRDTLAWWRTVPEARRTAARWPISPERERAVLAAWRARPR